MFRTLNPATGEILAEYPHASDSDLEEALSGLDQAYRVWRKKSISDRARSFSAMSGLLRQDIDKFSALIGLEMGKPVRFARSEIEKCALVCDFYVEEAEKLLRPVRVESKLFRAASKHFNSKGAVLAIMPWNYPFYQVFRFAVPNLIAGNAVLLKHSPNTPGCALAIEELFSRCCEPAGIFTSLFLSHQQCEKVIEDSRIVGVNLTGSVGAGRAVASLAGANLKKSVLELGGSDPLVVFADANVQRAAQVAADARLSNTGQICCAPKRIFVEASKKEEFQEAFVTRAEEKTIGNPEEEDVDLGPMAREDLKEKLEDQVRRSVQAGAVETVPACQVPDSGFYTVPRLLSEGRSDNPALREELFGPVAWLEDFNSEEEAIFKANDTEYGLAASVWTEEPEKAARVSSDIEAGIVVVNGTVTSDPALPFGGVKSSGYGKELGEEGIKEFLNTQIVLET